MRFVKCIKGGFIMAKVRKIYNTGSNKKIIVVKTVKKSKQKPKEGNQFGSGNSEIQTPTGSKSKPKEILPDIKDMEKEVLKSIIGQDVAVRKIITAIYRAINFKTVKSNILVIGNSGTGKTETIKQIAKRLNIPYTIEDATKYTQEGYYGADVNEMILNLLENSNMDNHKAQNGIIVIDEIDKKAGHEVSHDVAGTEVLKSLLKIIEGTTIKVPVEMDSYNVNLVDFDTKNIIIIFLGAFSGLDIIRDKRLNSNPLGFSIKEETHKSKAKFLKQDLVKYGLPEEFVGRIDTIIEMNELTKKDLALILKKSELSIFKRYQNELSNMGITLIYNDDLFEKNHLFLIQVLESLVIL